MKGGKPGAGSERMDQRAMVRLLGRTLDVLLTMVAYVDKEERFVFVNQSYADWFQHPKAYFVGRDAREIVGERHFEQAASLLRQALAGDTVTFDDQVRDTWRGRRIVRGAYVPDRDENGEIRGCYIVVDDITEWAE